MKRVIADLRTEIERLSRANVQSWVKSSGAMVCKSPSGGIAGGTLAAGTCAIWTKSGTSLVATSRTIEVTNLSSQAIVGGALMVALLTNIGYVSVWEDC